MYSTAYSLQKNVARRSVLLCAVGLDHIVFWLGSKGRLDPVQFGHMAVPRLRRQGGETKLFPVVSPGDGGEQKGLLWLDTGGGNSLNGTCAQYRCCSVGYIALERGERQREIVVQVESEDCNGQ